MTVFNLSTAPLAVKRSSQLAFTTQEHLTRLGNTFRVDVVALKEEFMDFQARAQVHFTRLQDSVASWKQAMQEVTRREEVSCRHPHENLQFVLAAYLVISMSDAKLERFFSLCDRRSGPYPVLFPWQSCTEFDHAKPSKMSPGIAKVWHIQIHTCERHEIWQER